MEEKYEVCCVCGEKIVNNPIIIKGEHYCNGCALEKIEKEKKK